MKKIPLRYPGFIVLLFSALCIFADLNAQPLQRGSVTIQYSPGHPANRFVPAKTVGGAIDGHGRGDINRMLTPGNIREMMKAGLGPVSYRLRTELAGEVWHWNPKGKWSEENKQQGYWISDSMSADPISLSYGYRLPRRGNTFDQADNDGYSRIDDGDTASFWKSNPYLSRHFTGEPDSLHPQWVIVDLDSVRPVNALRINWGDPFARSVKIAWASDIGDEYFDPFQPDLWNLLPGKISTQNGRDRLIIFSSKPLQARFIRITLDSSVYAGRPVKDIRDKLGYAIRKLEIGEVDSNGKFHDLMRHAPDNRRQTIVFVSSTDPWHRASDRDPDVEQVGVDRFFNSGITRGLPVLMPSGLLYDTPENMVNLLKYLKRKKYPVEEMEMGEEPEGQRVSPKDYAELYLQWGKRLKEVIPSLRLGGPGFAAIRYTKDDDGSFTEADWTKMFLAYLHSRHADSFFNFFSFEWYPFDDICADPAPQLAAAPGMLRAGLDNIRRVIPAGTPLYMTEYGYSAYAGKAEVNITGALMYADILGRFLTLGGGKSFLYGYEPGWLETNGCGFGNNMMLELQGGREDTVYRTAAFYGMSLLTGNWLKPEDAVLEVFPASGNILDSRQRPLVTAYALLEPSGKWSVALINKDPHRSFHVTLTVSNVLSGKKTRLHPSRIIQYSGRQYRWDENGSKGHPSLSLPPVEISTHGNAAIGLPPYSLTVVRAE